MAKILKTVKIKNADNQEVVYAEVKDNKPVYVDDQTNQEIPIDAAASSDTIARLNREAQTRREEAEGLATQLEQFKDIDPVKAREAITTVANLESGDLLKANKVEEIKAAAIKATEDNYKARLTAAEEKIKTVEATNNKITGELHNERRTNAFANSTFVKDKLAVPAAIAEKVYGDRFKVEDGKLVALDPHGQKIYSQLKPGELPEFDEAIEMVVGADPNRASMLKGTGNSGGGGTGTGGTGRGGANDGKSMSRKAFDGLNPAEKMLFMQKGGQVADD